MKFVFLYVSQIQNEQKEVCCHFGNKPLFALAIRILN